MHNNQFTTSQNIFTPPFLHCKGFTLFLQGGIFLKRFLSLALVFVIALSLSVPCFADGETALCPNCGQVLSETIRNEGFKVNHYYTCNNTSCGYSSVVTEILGYQISADGLLPHYSDGNVQYTVPSDKVNSSSGQFLPGTGAGRISSDGYYRIPLHVSGGTLKNSFGTATTPVMGSHSSTSLSVFVPNTVEIKSGISYSYYLVASTSTPLTLSADIPFLGTWKAYFKYTASGSSSACPFSGSYYSTSGGKSDTLCVATYTGSGSYTRDFVQIGSDVKLGFMSISESPFSGSIDWYMQCTPSDIAVSDNNYVNTTDKTFTVNGDTVTYDNAYYDNGVYYVYTDSNNTCTTYYTDNTGAIIGNVTVDNSNTSNIVYNITVYNVTNPDDSGSSSGGSSSGGSDSGGSSSGGSSSDGSGDSGTNIWDKIGEFIGSVLGGALDVIGAALGKILDILTQIVNDAAAGIKTLVESLLDSLTLLLNFSTGFGDFLKQFFYWLPEEVVAILVVSISLGIILAIIKFFRG